MFSYKKYIFPFLIGCLAITPANAQGRATNKVMSLRLPWNRPAVSQKLSKRVAHSYLEAITAQQEIKEPIEMGSVAFRMNQPLRTTPQTLYPQVPFLTTPQQLGDYLMARNNREFLSFLKTDRQRFDQIQQQLADFKKGRRSIVEGEEINWIVSQIPDETSLLLLGECHYIDDIKLSMMQLLPALRDKYPNRPMVLFTEFLPEGFLFNNMPLNEEMSKYTPIWLMAQNAEIPVIGLEPSFVKDNHNCAIMEIVGEEKKDIWGCYEGIRLRDAQWANFIKTFRQYQLQKYPEWKDMLFIVYAGAGHTEYSRAYSLPGMFPTENIFSVSFYPSYLPSAEGGKEYPVSNFDAATNSILIKDRTLQYKNPTLARLAGFNIRFKVDPIHQIDGFIGSPENFSPEEFKQILEDPSIQNLLNNP